MRAGELLGAQPADLRPDDRDSRFAGNIIPTRPVGLGLDEHPRRSSIPRRTPPARIGTSGQPVNNYLINPVKERQDNQFDVKVDHNLTANNRFFTRYSYEKTHRLQPATLPHGDAGATFGAGDGNIKAQGFAFNDTHTFGSNWLNEFRFGWTSIKFFMTSIDYGENLAAQMGIPGINTAPATSAMTQLTFQNIRNLGANSNQPLITNQNDFQIFDNVTWIKGRHTMKTGGSLTLRSREILNADNIVGQFQFNNNQTSNCAGQPASCVLNSNTGFDVASFLLGYTVAEDPEPLGAHRERRDRDLHGEAAGVLGVRAGRLARVQQADAQPGPRGGTCIRRGSRSTTGSRTSTRRPARSSSRPTTRTIGGVDVGRRLQTYSKGDVGPRLGFAYDLNGDGKTIVRGGYGVFWNFTPGGTSSSKAQNQPFLQSLALTPTPVSSTGVNLQLVRTACRRRPASIRASRRPATRGRSSTRTSATATRRTST